MEGRSFYQVALFLELHSGNRFVVHNRQSVCKEKWVAIRPGNRVCYAQWEDVGPFRTDHWQYVFVTSVLDLTERRSRNRCQSGRSYLPRHGGDRKARLEIYYPRPCSSPLLL